MIIPDTDGRLQPDNFGDGATNDLSVIADQLKMVLETQFEIKITKEKVWYFKSVWNEIRI